MTPGEELKEIAYSLCSTHQGKAFHPGCIDCMRSYAAVKAGYERAVRNYDWVVIKSIRAERVGESPAPATPLKCPHCNQPARKVDWCHDYRSPHICPTDHISHARPDLYCKKCGGLLVDVGENEKRCSHETATPQCDFHGCTCGRVEFYKAARAEYLRVRRLTGESRQ